MRIIKSDGFVKSPSAELRFTFVAAAYHASTPHSGGFARRVPRNAGELFTKPSLWRLFTRSSRVKGEKANRRNGSHRVVATAGLWGRKNFYCGRLSVVIIKSILSAWRWGNV
ncbi:MAG: hypothetical protein NTY64_05070 [Deltaproteobacteria bacterium]|nr:hypothetical protein [Deltaproteobacteria bacterium]